MQAIILAGGEGKGIRPLTNAVPKPMLPVMNKPLLCHTIELLKKHGICDILITLCYRGDDIKAYFGDGSRFGVSIKYFIENESLGTAGSIKSTEKLINDSFLVISGDVITDIDLGRALSFHKQNKADATILLTSVENPTEYSAVITSEDNRVMHLCENPDWDEVCTDIINTGIYILEPKILSLIPPFCPYDLSKNLLKQMLRMNLSVFGHKTEGYWCDIGSARDYRKCHKDIFDGKVNIGIEENILKRGILTGKDCKISDSAELLPYCVLGDGCTVGDNVSLKDCIVWHDAKIDANSRLHDSVIATNSPLSEAQKSETKKLINNKVSGQINIDITPDFAAKLCAAYAGALDKNPSVVLNFPDLSEGMSLKFAMLSGLIAAGAKVYNLCGINDRGAAKFATRHLNAHGAINVSIEKGYILTEFFDSSGALASKSLIRKVLNCLEREDITYVSPDKTQMPVNVNDITDYYLKDIIAYTNYRRLNFSVGICTDSDALCETFKKLGSLLGIKFLFTNKPQLLSDMIKSNRLDFALEIAQDGSCILTDDTSVSMDKDLYFSMVTLICGSAVKGSSVYVPIDSTEAADSVAKALGCSIIRIKERDIEAHLLAQNTPASRLEYALYCDPVRAVVRICEFLYLNNCALSEAVSVIPKIYKISRSIKCPDNKKGAVMRQLFESEQTPQFEADGGISLRTKDGRVLIMPDITAERIRVISESENAQFATEAADEFCYKLERFIN